MNEFIETLLLMAVPVLWFSAIRYLIRRDDRMVEANSGQLD